MLTSSMREAVGVTLAEAWWPRWSLDCLEAVGHHLVDRDRVVLHAVLIEEAARASPLRHEGRQAERRMREGGGTASSRRPG